MCRFYSAIYLKSVSGMSVSSLVRKVQLGSKACEPSFIRFAKSFRLTARFARIDKAAGHRLARLANDHEKGSTVGSVGAKGFSFTP